MDLACLTSQWVTDTRLMDARDIRDGQIWVLQGKTNAKRRVEITGELKVLIDRIMSGKSEHKVRSTRLIVTEDGTPMSVAMMRGRFDAVTIKIVTLKPTRICISFRPQTLDFRWSKPESNRSLCR